jgi:hypothetical protein
VFDTGTVNSFIIHLTRGYFHASLSRLDSSKTYFAEVTKNIWPELLDSRLETVMANKILPGNHRASFLLLKY